jgi:inward rectifier potassium channel
MAVKRRHGRPRKTKASTIHLGGIRVKKVGVPRFHWGDPYHLLLTISWSQFLALVATAYLAANAAFALAYLAGGPDITNAEPGSFVEAFFFSVETMATVGYGVMSPSTLYANILSAIEGVTGLLGFAIVTGLSFARFARPTARVLFSRVAVVRPFDGVPTLMFRVGNQRHNNILEARVRMSLLQDEQSAEGDTMRRFHDLRLVRSQTPVFGLTWTVMHPIDGRSLLSGLTPADLEKVNGEILVTLTGLDETFGQLVHARHSFRIRDIHWNMRFVDIIGPEEDGERAIDYTRFHDIAPME